MVYKSFGVFGFTKVQEKKSVELQRYWMRHLKSYIKGYFQLPKIIITLIFSLCIFLYIKQGYLYPLKSQIDEITWILIKSGISLTAVIPLGIYSKRRLVSTDKKLLCIDAYMMIIASFTWIPLYIFIEPLFFMRPSLPWYVLFSMSILIAVSIILIHAMIFVFPERLKAEVEQNYNHLIAS